VLSWIAMRHLRRVHQGIGGTPDWKDKQSLKHKGIVNHIRRQPAIRVDG
jgi:hypothetical protein